MQESGEGNRLKHKVGLSRQKKELCGSDISNHNNALEAKRRR